MLFLGVIFLVMGIAGEAIAGTWFEEFFNPRFPHTGRPWWQGGAVLRVWASRLFLCLGVALIVVGGVIELT